MMWQEIILLSSLLIITEQKPSIYFESETDLLEEIRGIRNTDNADIIYSSKIQRFYETDIPLENENEETTTQINTSDDLEEENDRKIRDTQTDIITVASTSSTSSSPDEETTITDEETSTTVPCDKIDIFAVILKFATKNFEDDSEIERRSVKEVDLEEIEGEEDLDTAANTVFRPLFAYRQQEARRRRFRTLNN